MAVAGSMVVYDRMTKMRKEEAVESAVGEEGFIDDKAVRGGPRRAKIKDLI